MTDHHLRAGFPEDQRDLAAALFWQAFGGKFGKLPGSKPRALSFLAPTLDPTHCLSVCAGDGKLGPCGLQDGRGGVRGRLNVINTNPRARALYERRGFQAFVTEDVFPFRWLFGFSTSTKMTQDTAAP